MSDEVTISGNGVPLLVPGELVKAMTSFALDKGSGNVQVNFRDGRILGFRVERIVSLKQSGI